MRKERALKIREETFKQQERFHFPDGELQEARDRLLARSFDTGDGSNRWYVLPQR